MNTILQQMRLLWKADTFSPAGLVARAFVLTAFFSASELLGWKEYTTFLSGTSGNPDMSWEKAATLGLIHLFFYFGFILVAPICLIAAGLLAAWGRWSPRDAGAKARN